MLCVVVIFPFPQYVFQPKPKIVLCWTNMDYAKVLRDAQTQYCPHMDNMCHYTNDRHLINNASAVMFFWRSVNDEPDPSTRNPDQRYVFFLLESPHNTGMDFGDKNNGYFNWTMTYRLDSDIVSPYLRVNRRGTNSTSKLPLPEVPFNKLESQLNKTGEIAWFVTNCYTTSQREMVARYLKIDGLDVDVYGGCGDGEHICDGHGLVTECDSLINNYYFYLAMENSICRDYVTEKVTRALQYGAVPIVLRRDIAAPLIPGESFIAVDDFPTIEELAKHLRNVMNDVDAYSKYFRWHQTHDLVSYYQTVVGDTVCDLCAKLHLDTEPKVVEDLGKWLGKNYSFIPQMFQAFIE